MRCLYCGKQLPLLKKLTGGGEFCSEAHRQKYQEEYNKLALSRLLQTQNADTEAPHRGELVLSSRQHPALQAGRTPLRALEAPKSADSPLAGNWNPGANRTQRALPPPSQPINPIPIPGLKTAFDTPAAAPPQSEPASFLKPFNRAPLPALTPPASPLPSKPDSSFRFDQQRPDQARPEPPKAETPRAEPAAHKTGGKRDAFSFRPIDPFPVEKPAPPPPPPAPVVEQAAQPAGPAAAIKPPAIKEEAPRKEEMVPQAPKPAPAPAASAPPKPVDPPEAAFMVEEVRRAEAPAVAKLEVLGADCFTNGHPPKPDGWTVWDPEIQGPPGKLEEPDQLFPLTGPPGESTAGQPGQFGSLKAASEQERQEIRKKILENQVQPGNFQQTVPTAPSGPNTVLAICRPAPALESLAMAFKAKAAPENPTLHSAPPATGDDFLESLSTFTSLNALASLYPIDPEVPAQAAETAETAAAPARPAASPSAAASEPGKAATAPVSSLKPSNGIPPSAKPPMVETPRNYKAAEALKSAAQNVIIDSAPMVEVRQPDKPAPVRHEVFVDLSVLGIEEDEDADAEFVAGEGESPPGVAGGATRRRRNSNAREAVRDLVTSPTVSAAPAEAKLARSFEPLDWTNPGVSTLRLAGLPLRPKVVFEPAPIVVPQPLPAKAEPAKVSSPLAAAWSAKRLKRIETATVAPVESGRSLPVESPVEPPVLTGNGPQNETPVGAAAPAAQTAKIEDPAALPPAPPVPVLKPVDEVSVDEVAVPAAPAVRVQEVSTPQTVKIETARDQAAGAQTPPPAPEPKGKEVSAPLPAKIETAKHEAADIQTAPPAPATIGKEFSAPLPAKAETTHAPAQHKTGHKGSGKSKAEAKKAVAAAKLAAAAKATAAPPPVAPVAAAVTPAVPNPAPAPAPLPEKPPFDAPLLGSGAPQNSSFWANLPVLPKIALALGLSGAIAGGAWFTLHPSGKAATTTETPRKVSSQVQAGRSLMMNLPGGWNPDFGGDFNRKKNRTIAIYRPSLNNDDYRMEFEGQIDSKAIGWVYRATDAKNYYAYKIELIRSGPDPGAALAHYTVVNGYETQKHFTPLVKPMRAGSSFRVRLDVLGDEFSAFINDELIEVWQDDRLSKGGFGMMNEAGEIGQIRKLQVFELLP